MSELELHQPHNSLTEQMDYARTVSTASMLPDNYRGKPADIMLAVGLGQSMGLSPAESLYRIAVIKGKPTASAELIAANVRKAGHRLRVSGTDTSATATIIRADDTDYEFTVTRDIAWARGMGLDSQPNYKKQPGTMLQWRAITAVARLACPEALYGVAYSSDEMSDVGEQRQASSGGLASAMASTVVELLAEPPQTGDSGGSQAETSVAEGAAGSIPAGNPPESSPLLNTRGPLAKRMFAAMGSAGITDRDDRLAYASATVGRTVGSSGELTDADAEHVIAALAEFGAETTGAQA